MTEQIEKLYKVSEVKDILSISRDVLYKMIKKGKIRTVKVHGMIRIPASAIEEVKES